MCEYPKTPKRVRDRVVMDMSPSSAKALRDMAADLGCQVRDVGTALTDLVSELQADHDRRALEIADLRRRVSASEEARRLALEQRDKWQREYVIYHFMTAWDHVQAAFRKRPVVGTLILGAAAWCIGTAGAVGHIIVRGM